MAAYDPAEGITDVSGRKVYYMPLPPLGLKHYEAELLARELDDKARTQRVNKDEAQSGCRGDSRAVLIQVFSAWSTNQKSPGVDLFVVFSTSLCDSPPRMVLQSRAMWPSLPQA